MGAAQVAHATGPTAPARALDSDRDGLGLEEVVDAHRPVLAPEARLLEAAEGDVRPGRQGVVRADDVRFVTAMTSRSRSVLRRPIPSDGRTRVLAAGFTDGDAAQAAEALLRARFPAEGIDIGSIGVRVPAFVSLTLTIVAVRAPVGRVLEARGILVGHGGTVIADVDESDPATRVAGRVRRRGRKRGPAIGAQPVSAADDLKAALQADTVPA